MEIKDVQKRDKLEWVFSVRCTESQRLFIEKNNLSPTKIFRTALQNLMKNENKNNSTE